MPNSTPKNDNTIANKLLTSMVGWPWLEISAETWKVIKKLGRGLANEGTYNVLSHEVTLELKDEKGEKAHIHKLQHVRYLQNNISTFQDQAWGDGNILRNYKCSPGNDVDRYKTGHKTQILISLRDQRYKGDEDEFILEWDMLQGFVTKREQWGSEINHPTKQMILQIIFPQSRPPQRVSIVEYLQKKNKLLPQEALRELPDGRWQVTWQKKKPRLHERYILRWEW